MQFNTGEISIAPKTVFWFEMPKDVPSSLQVELLKRDILLIPCSWEERKLLTKELKQKSAFVFNFGAIFSGAKDLGADNKDKLKNFLIELKTNFTGRSLVHTSIINKKLAVVFQKNRIFYIEKNLANPQTAANIISSLAHKVIPTLGKGRSSIRVQLFPQTRIQAEIRKKGLREKNYKAYIKDISVGGIGVILENIPDGVVTKGFKLKDIVEVKTKLPKGSVHISQAIIMRVSEQGDELGIFFNPSNVDMVDTESSHTISNFILDWIEQLLKSVGKFSDLSNSQYDGNFNRLK